MGLEKLPLAKGQKHVAAFKRGGWVLVRKRSGGSHRVLKKDGVPHLLTIPCTRQPVKRPLLAAQINLAGLTEDEYLVLFAGRRGKR